MSERAYQETKTTTGTSLDPVEYAVLSQALMAAGREMGVKLIRSSYSNIVREAQDASAALFDRAGNVVAQAELIPMQLGPMSDIFRACAAVVPPEDLKEGDFYIITTLTGVANICRMSLFFRRYSYRASWSDLPGLCPITLIWEGGILG